METIVPVKYLIVEESFVNKLKEISRNTGNYSYFDRSSRNNYYFVIEATRAVTSVATENMLEKEIDISSWVTFNILLKSSYFPKLMLNFLPCLMFLIKTTTKFLVSVYFEPFQHFGASKTFTLSHINPRERELMIVIPKMTPLLILILRILAV